MKEPSIKEGGRGPRVADHLRERLADIIRAEMRDPRVGMVSVNDVRVTRDLAYADITFGESWSTTLGEVRLGTRLLPQGQRKSRVSTFG